MTPEERAANVVQDYHARRAWGYDPVQHAEYETLIAAAIRDAVTEERERCLQTIRDCAAECRMTAAESWTQGESLKYLLKAETADALAYALRLKEPTR